MDINSAKRSASYVKSIASDKLEGDMDALIKTLQPSATLLELVNYVWRRLDAGTGASRRN